MKYVPLLIVILALPSCTVTGGSNPVQVEHKNSFQEDLKLLRQGEEQAKIIKQFADAAASKNIELTLSLIWPDTKKEFGEDGWRKYISDTLYPFFRNYKGIDSYEHISTMNMELRNTPAFIHFGYIRDASGARQPFDIVVVSIEEKHFIANVYVGECKKGLHPVCE